MASPTGIANNDNNNNRPNNIEYDDRNMYVQETKIRNKLKNPINRNYKSIIEFQIYNVR